MGKKSGVFALLMGVAAGAAAVFLSKKENREVAKATARKVVSKARKARAEYTQDPAAFKNKVKTQAQKTAKKVTKKAVAVAKKQAHKTAKKVASKTAAKKR